jgi:hypothetical protein
VTPLAAIELGEDGAILRTAAGEETHVPVTASSGCVADGVAVLVTEDGVVGLDSAGAELWRLDPHEEDPVVSVTCEEGAPWLFHFYGTTERIDPVNGSTLEEGFEK